MADNTAQTGAATIAADDVTTLNGAASAGVLVQRVKVTYGDDNAARDVSMLFPLPTFDPDVATSTAVTAQDVGSTTATSNPTSWSTHTSVTGTPTAGSFARIDVSGEDAFSGQITGTWTGTLQVERSVDGGTTWTDIGAYVAGSPGTSKTFTQNCAFHGNASAVASIRLRATTAWTGTATIVLRTGSGTGTVTLGTPVGVKDFSNPTVQLAVKAGSTAVAAIDTAVSVGLHPSSPLPAGTAAIGSVSVSNFPATQPVSLATNTPDVTDRAARLLGVLSAGANQVGTVGELRAGTLTQTATGAAAAATATLPAAGAGLFHYVTNIRCERYLTATGTASATRAAVTTANLNGLAFTLPQDNSALGIQSVPVDFRPTTPQKAAAANTATTVSTPAIPGTTYLIVVTYFTAA